MAKEIKTAKNGFELFVDGNLAAEITYSVAGESLLIIDHTLVMEGYNGGGYGKELVYQVVELARSEGKKIMPLCPFAKLMFDNNEDIRDVLK